MIFVLMDLHFFFLNEVCMPIVWWCNNTNTFFYRALSHHIRSVNKSVELEAQTKQLKFFKLN